jgi:hypothetical protein
MKQLGFENSWIKLIMMCVPIVQFLFLVNGVPMGKNYSF